LSPRSIGVFVRARREAWLDELELHVRGGFYAAYFGMHKRLSGSDLQSSLPRSDKTMGDEVSRLDSWAARSNEFFRAKDRREQRMKNRG
jgi:hypothetical protein